MGIRGSGVNRKRVVILGSWHSGSGEANMSKIGRLFFFTVLGPDHNALDPSGQFGMVFEAAALGGGNRLRAP